MTKCCSNRVLHQFAICCFSMAALRMKSYGDPPAALEDVTPDGHEGLMSATGDTDDIGNFDMPDVSELPRS